MRRVHWLAPVAGRGGPGRSVHESDAARWPRLEADGQRPSVGASRWHVFVSTSVPSVHSDCVFWRIKLADGRDDDACMWSSSQTGCPRCRSPRLVLEGRRTGARFVEALTCVDCGKVIEADCDTSEIMQDRIPLPRTPSATEAIKQHGGRPSASPNRTGNRTWRRLLTWHP